MADINSNSYYILLGTNQGNKLRNINTARRHIQGELGKIKMCSSIYETEPWGKREQDTFLNQVIELEVTNNPENTLSICLGIEKKMGRVRIGKWMERIIDIDILYINSEIIDTPGLTVPHPEIQNRRFTLVPLVEIAGNYIHPKLKKTNNQLLDSCSDQLNVNTLISNP